jgi:hypothetical protein
MDWAVRNPGGGENFRTRPDWPPPGPAHPTSCTMGIGSVPGVKRPAHDTDQSPNLGSRLKKEYSYTSTPLLGLCRLFYGELHLLRIFTEKYVTFFFHNLSRV